jgi:hypothetical protein
MAREFKEEIRSGSFTPGFPPSSPLSPPPNSATDWRICVALGLLSFLAEGLYGASSFGPSITFNVGWQVCYLMGLGDGSMTQVAAHLTIMEASSAALQTFHLWDSIDWPLVVARSVPCCTFIALGQWLMILIDRTPSGGDWLKRSLGILLFLLWLKRVRALLSQRAQPASQPASQPARCGDKLVSPDGSMSSALLPCHSTTRDATPPINDDRTAASAREPTDSDSYTVPLPGAESPPPPPPPPPSMVAPATPEPKARSKFKLDVYEPAMLRSILFWFSLAGLMGGLVTMSGPAMMIFLSIHASHVWDPNS